MNSNIDAIVSAPAITIVVNIIKIFFICLFTYYTSLRILNIKKFLNKNLIFVLPACLLTSIIYLFISNMFDFFSGAICIFLLLGTLFSLTTKNKIGYSLLLTLTSLSINFAIFFIVIFINAIINIIHFISNDYINVIIMVFTQIAFLYLLFKIRKFKDGFNFIKDDFKNEYFDIAMLCLNVIILFLYDLVTSLQILSFRSLISSFIITAIVIFITIRKLVVLYYNQKLLKNENKEMKLELDEKNKKITELQKENLNFSKTSHSIAHRQKSIEHMIKELAKNEIALESDIFDRVKSISTDSLNLINNYPISKTEITQIDDMLKFMQCECIENDIRFDLKIEGNLHHMVNKYISKEDLEILIADLIKNAIIATKTQEFRSILVKLGLFDGYYSLYVYDSGIEFKSETLSKIGTTPTTTYSNTGGTGFGLLNTFETINKYKASFIINEKHQPTNNDYTKFICVRFDGKNNFKISSYRFEKLKKEVTSKFFSVEHV